MKSIAIDVRTLETPTKNRGIGYFTLNHISHVLKYNRNFQIMLYTTLSGNGVSNKMALKSSKIWHIPTMFRPRRGIRRLDPIFSFFWNTALQLSKPDLLHITSLFEHYYLSIPKSIKTIVTLHDVIPILFEKQLFENEKAKQWWMGRLMQVKNASKVITISYASKKDIQKILQIPEEKIIVIYGQSDKRFTPQPLSKVKKILSEKYNIKNPYILSVSAFSFHKNMQRVFKAFKNYINQSSKKPLNLVVVCKLLKSEEILWKQEVHNLGIKNKVIFTNFVSDEDLPLFYSGASAFLFPSLYEGFGLPVLESMACGTPVITSNLSSLPELGGKAAYYVDPYKVDDITLGIRKVLEGEDLRRKMIHNGFNQIKKFSWDKAAQQTLKIYEEVLNN